MSDTDQDSSDYTLAHVITIIGKLKRKLARYERHKSDLEGSGKFVEIPKNKNISGTTIPIELAKKLASYTLEQLQDFDGYIIGGEEYGINVRGDTIDADANYMGHYNFKTEKLTKGGKAPPDWSRITALM